MPAQNTTGDRLETRDGRLALAARFKDRAIGEIDRLASKTNELI